MSWLRVLSALTLLLAWSGRASAGPNDVRRFAIIIGNNQPESASATRLRYADDDALATRQLLAEAGVETRLLVRIDEGTRGLHPEARADGLPRLDDLRKNFQALANKMRALSERGIPTELLFFYGGHGDVDRGEGYVVFEDQRLTRSMLFALLKSSPATRNHVFVDACKSYYLVFDRGPGGRRSPYALFEPGATPAGLENTGFVLSTSSDRDSHEWERYQGGVLSHELRSALRGAADVDLDGRITYAELGAFLSAANQSIKNPRFRPDFKVQAPRRDLDLALLSWSPEQAGLELRSNGFGHVYVETARGERVLDAHPSPGQALRLWVPAERPLFVRRQDERGELVVTRRERTEVSALSETPQVARRGALSLAFEWLFETPFGNDDVRRFRSAALAEQRDSVSNERKVRSRDALPWVSGGLAIAAGAAGLTLSGLSLGSSLSKVESQVDIAHVNERVRDFNRASLPLYGVAAAAGLTWVWATLLRTPPSVTVAPTSLSVAGGSGFGVDVGGHF
ncbi:MAG: caspase family protein [Polyangiaceae bacterium]